MEISESQNNAGEHGKKRKDYLKKLQERFRPFWEDVKNQAHTAKFWLEVAAIFGLATYTSIAGCQAKIAHDTYVAANRPYVGVEGIIIDFGSSKNRDMSIKKPTNETDFFNFTTQIKNYGPVPGTNYVSSRKVYLGEKSQPIQTIPERSQTIFPGQIFQLPGFIGTKDYHAIINGDTLLVEEVTIDYDGPHGHTHYCEKLQYAPKYGSFITLGECAK